MQEIIDDVGETTWQRIKTTKRRSFFKLLAFSVVWYAVFGLLTYFFTDIVIELGKISAFMAIVPIVSFGIWYNDIKSKVADDFMKQFAAANMYHYEEYTKATNLAGSLFTIGHSKEAEDEVSGKYLDQPIRLFTYHYTMGSGKSAHTYNYMVFELTFDTHLPRMLLRSRKQSFTFDHPNEVRLEGNFSDYYEFGVDAQYEIEGLQVFTPDFMAYLLDLPNRFSLELIDNKLFIYSDKVITKRNELHYFYDVAKQVTERLAPVLPRLKKDVLALDEVFKKAE
jgi:hypothetical protein